MIYHMDTDPDLKKMFVEWISAAIAERGEAAMDPQWLDIEGWGDQFEALASEQGWIMEMREHKGQTYPVFIPQAS